MRSARVFLPLIAVLLAAILLTACNLPFSSSDEPESAPTQEAAQPAPPQAPDAAASPSGSLIFMPQQMQSGASTTGIASLIFFWPEPVPQGLTVDVERSYADDTGYNLELSSETVSAHIMGGDTAAPAWAMAVETGTESSTRGQPAIILETEGGVAVNWTENGNYYLVAGMGMDINEVQALINTLISTDLAGFQARLAQ